MQVKRHLMQVIVEVVRVYECFFLTPFQFQYFGLCCVMFFFWVIYDLKLQNCLNMTDIANNHD